MVKQKYLAVGIGMRRKKMKIKLCRRPDWACVDGLFCAGLPVPMVHFFGRPGKGPVPTPRHLAEAPDCITGVMAGLAVRPYTTACKWCVAKSMFFTI